MMKRLKLNPQIHDYDELANSQISLPYMMFYNKPNYVSNSVNTGSKGCRLTLHSKTGSYLGVDQAKDFSSVNICVGGSTAFGVGAKSDANTIPSHLNCMTESSWINISGRAFTTTQEILIYLFYNSYFNKVKNLLSFSGANDLMLFFQSHYYSKDFGSFFGYNNYLNNFKSKKNYKSIYQMIKSRLLKNSSMLDSYTDDHFKIHNHLAERDIILENIDRNMKLWNTLSKQYGFKFYFVLQPTPAWITKKSSKEENMLFSELDKITSQSSSHPILYKVFNEEMYLWYSRGLKDICDENNILFIDMNAELSGLDGIDGKWMFIDRVHLNDYGYCLCANIINKILGDKWKV